jgi:hypothetical protein
VPLFGRDFHVCVRAYRKILEGQFEWFKRLYIAPSKTLLNLFIFKISYRILKGA